MSLLHGRMGYSWQSVFNLLDALRLQRKRCNVPMQEWLAGSRHALCWPKPSLPCWLGKPKLLNSCSWWCFQIGIPSPLGLGKICCNQLHSKETCGSIPAWCVHAGDWCEHDVKLCDGSEVVSHWIEGKPVIVVSFLFHLSSTLHSSQCIRLHLFLSNNPYLSHISFPVIFTPCSETWMAASKQGLFFAKSMVMWFRLGKSGNQGLQSGTGTE